VNDSRGRRLLQPIGNLHAVPQRFTDAHSLAPDRLIERLARHVLHRDELNAVCIRDVVDVTDG
jgi:hypothetical protein